MNLESDQQRMSATMDYRCPVPESPITESKCCDLERALTFKYVTDLKWKSETFESVIMREIKSSKHLLKDGENHHNIDLFKHFPSMEVPIGLPEIDQVKYVSILLLDFFEYLHQSQNGFETLDLVIQTAGNGDNTLPPDVNYVKPAFDKIPKIIKTFYEKSKSSLDGITHTEILGDELDCENQITHDLELHALKRQLLMIIGQLRLAATSLHTIFL
uniref:Uncharacterized protein n=1 Tax=Clytia hemisphaerica TaxID=252671 RepID=A0A7M5X0N9_9CNID